ncbi:DNA polymerase III subunit gamma/tau [Candidatus Tenderia electrophaga]|jgi:DNA polymerase-3 subunit gamma/tau|uniref:DNA polymerase III subunit gamma/tau n=1 Tax=Candidatus Tenderia electrophaga TaxID=1748243 RepID=A0A0S2TDD6_9GAMM|nr:DNA polymerase III subunit gamma/tau [Candidatus Tenderia electrophaga]
MSYQVLARKWRPRNFPAMVGQAHVLRALINALDNERLHHAYLFTGTRGVGKTTVARIFAKSLNCETGVSSTPCGECGACREIDEGRFVDLIEVDAASRTKVEDTRELLENVQYAPTRGRYKVYLIDEVHMLSAHSFNALLKTLEEPPPHVKFLLATTDPQKLPVTILSRCLQFNLKRMAPEMIGGHLAHVLAQEGVEFDPAALTLIAAGADGSMRDALSLLDQAIAYGGGKLVEDEVRAMLGTIDRGHVLRLLQGLADNDATAILETVNDLAQQGTDFSAVLAELISQLHTLALAQLAPATLEGLADQQALAALADKISAEDIQLYYQIGLIGRRDLPLAPELRSGLEMVLLRMLAFRPDSSTAQPEAQAQTPVTGHARPATTSAPAERRPSAVQEPAPPTAPTTGPDACPWPEVVQQLGLKGMAYQLAANSVLVGRQGTVIRLALSKQHATLRSKTLEQRLQQALSKYYGESVRLEFVSGGDNSQTPAGIQQRQAEDRQQAAVDAISTDPNVQRIREVFDAQVVPDSVRPLEQ